MILDRARVEAALPGYELFGVLGSGGFGLVIEARHIRLDRRTAVKVLALPAVAPAEARLLARLRHPHIVEIFDYVEDDGLGLLVMELCDGGTLRSRAAGGLPIAEVVGYGLAIAAALDTAHRQRVIHRDIKPDNVLFTAEGTLKVTDFGVAKMAATTAGDGGPNTIVGTPAYMAPEQFTGARLSPATDLYALGVVLHELLTGRTPPVAWPAGFAPTPPGRARAPKPGRGMLPPAIGSVVRHALAPEPTSRPGSALDLALALAHAAARDLGPGWLTACTSPLHIPDVVRNLAASAPTATRFPAAPAPTPPAPIPAPAPAPIPAPAPAPVPVPVPRTDTVHRAGGRLRRWAGRRTAGAGAPSRGIAHLSVDSPLGLATGGDGLLYVSQPLAHRVLRIDPAASPAARPVTGPVTGPDGAPAVVAIVAGSGKAGLGGDGGPATAADLDSPAGLALAPDGSLLIADSFNDRIRRVRPDGTIITVATSVPLRRPRAVTVAADGTLLVADTDGHRVWRIDLDGSAHVVAGTGSAGFSGDGGPAERAAIGRPVALATDAHGRLLVAVPEHRRVRRVGLDGRVETIAGTGYGGRPAADGGIATSTDMGTPTGLALSPDGTCYVADPSGERVLAVRPDGVVAVIASRPGVVPVRDPRQLAVGADGTLYIAQPGRNRVTVVAPAQLPQL
ncbi:hypothetical protein CcI49_25750 [Frankia sp. CcI49]|uniref:serine/threonine-protein kinase n=1 Tax=Frankia sp. CcI49 TaxID=1745382 RepID=UPI0009762701|nr:serine/threonine-protein kinase [Frankia sp. CcI49]ONH57841.1 hypothetical protein CcI49_25750 [Frankia sp. CcI49]